MIKKYVIFKVDSEEYGVSIESVREITEYKNKKISKLPDTSFFVEGIINLRGIIVPIISLKKLFKIEKENDKDSRIIIVGIDNKQIGFIVDDASQVLQIDEIENAPEIIIGDDKKYISGIAKIKEKLIVILDFKKILTCEDKEKIFNIKN